MVDSSQSFWYACYTKSRAEKVAAKELESMGIEHYLPLIKTSRRWSDRIKWVEVPLLKSYVFVKVSRENYLKVLSMNSLVRYVTFEGKAVPIPENQIASVRLLLNEGAELEVVSEKLEPGESIMVQAGLFMGLLGELIEYRGRKKVLVRIGKLSESILVTIPLELLIRNYKAI
ncbi:MAG: UpxY family transcription antiterminator [Lentimicrobium sp.]|nr:UpxY family transcription antiterminator [Lentimicrobium sp.]